jgi:hypothetical protein
MTRDDILRMAEQAGAHHLANVPGFTDFLARFAALAYEAGAKDAREACAQVGMLVATNGIETSAAIRARGQQRPEPTYPSDPIWREQKRLEMEAWARNKLARHGIQLPDEDEEYGNPSF